VYQKQVRRLSKIMDLRVKPKRKYKVKNECNHLSVAENKLHCQKARSRARSADIVNLKSQDDVFYLVVIIDLYSYGVIGWSNANRMTYNL
jgi:transposase InsO family protein